MRRGAAVRLAHASGPAFVPVTIFPDFTALIISGIVVLLAIALKAWLFEPLARTAEAREGRAKDARRELASAESALRVAEATRAEALAEARAAAYAEMDRVRTEASGTANERLVEARNRAGAALERGRNALRTQSAAAEGELDRAATALATELASRLLRRAS